MRGILRPTSGPERWLARRLRGRGEILLIGVHEALFDHARNTTDRNAQAGEKFGSSLIAWSTYAKALSYSAFPPRLRKYGACK